MSAPAPIMPRPDVLTAKAAVLYELCSSGPLGLDGAKEIVPRLAERGFAEQATWAALFDLEVRGDVVSLDGRFVLPADGRADKFARSLAAALGFLPGGQVASDAERVIGEHLERVRVAERERIAKFLEERSNDAHDTAALLRRAGSQQAAADVFAHDGLIWHRAARIAASGSD